VDQRAVSWRLFFNEFPVDDQSIGLFRKIKSVAEFDLSVSFSAQKNMGIRFVEAEDFVFISNTSSFDNLKLTTSDNVKLTTLKG